MATLIPFWLNWSQASLDMLDRRWKSKIAQAALKNPWQIVRIDNVILPGLARVKEVDQKLRVQDNKKGGGDGGRPTIRGRENPEFTITLEIHAPYQWIEWQTLKPTLNVVERPTDRDEHYVENPLIAVSGVTWCIVIGLKQFEPESGGPMKVDIRMLGCSEKKGATKVPTQGAIPATPTISLTPGAKAPVLFAQPVAPGPDFGR